MIESSESTMTSDSMREDSLEEERVEVKLEMNSEPMMIREEARL